MKYKDLKGLLLSIFAPILAVIVLLCFFTGISNISEGHNEEGLQQLEEALHRASVSCYAAEGFYPPNVDYLVEHYGVQIDHSRYAVSYIAFADNLMPDITVLEKSTHE